MNVKTSVRVASGVLVALLCLSLASCEGPRRRAPVENTWLDREPVGIDVGIVKPRVASNHEALVSPAMREAARRTLLDEKGYSLLTNEVVDAAMARAGMDAAGDASAASQVVDADCVVLINVTRWEVSELIPRGRIYASGTIRAAGRPNGRRIFERNFDNEVLLSPGAVTTLNRDDVERQMAADLVATSLANFLKKKN
jgi:hypothetical protein